MPLAGEAETQHAHHAFDFRLLEHEAFHLLHHVQGAPLCGTRRQLHVHQHRALVFIGQKRSWQALVHQRRTGQDGQVNDQVTGCTRQQFGDTAFIRFGRFGKAAVEPAKKTTLGMVVARLNWFQQGGT